MPSRREGGGGLYKDEQYRLERFASIIRWLRIFEQTTPALRATPPNFGGDLENRIWS